MKFKIEKLPGENDDFIACVEAQDLPVWVMLRRPPEAQSMMAGFFGRSVAEGVSILRPVSIPNTQKYNILHPEALSALIVTAVDDTPVRQAGRKMRASLEAENLSIWEEFLGEESEVTKSANMLSVSAEAYGQLAYIMKAKNSTMYLDRKKARDIKVGNPISGFDALKVQTAAAKTFPQLTPPSNLNIKAARKALEAVARPSSGALVWYGTHDTEKASIRMQAAESAPLLAGIIADNPTMARAVDAKESLGKMLMERTRITRGGMRRLAKITTPPPAEPLFDVNAAFEGEDALGVYRERRFRNAGHLSLDAALRPLSDLPADWTPSDNDSWNAYLGILSSCAYPLSNVLGIPVNDILKASKGKWAEFKEGLARAADFPVDNFDNQTMMLTSLDSIDAVDSFSRTVVLPLALRSISSVGQADPDLHQEYLNAGFNAAQSVLIGKSKNIAATCFELSRRFASRLVYLDGIMGREGIIHSDKKWAQYGDNSFPKLFDDFEASNGLVLRHLDTRDKFTQESERLRHCVGRSQSYFNSSMTGDTIIISIQSPSGEESFSTLQISGVSQSSNTPAERLAVPRQTQHRAENNNQPSAESTAAAEEFKQAWKNGGVALRINESREWWDYVSRNRQNLIGRTSNMITWGSALELDWRDEGKCDDTWNEWRHILTGSLAQADSPEVLYRNSEVRNLVGTLSPQAAVLLQQEAKKRSQAAKNKEDASPEP